MLIPQKSVRILALFLTICMMSLPVLSREGDKKEKNKVAPASPTSQLAGKLVTRGNQPVMVNGYVVGTGTTILTGAKIQTFNDTKASVRLGKLGSFELSPNSTATLSFIGEEVTGTLKRGCALLTTNPNISGALSTPEGMLTKTDSSKLSSVKVCVPGTEEASSAPPEPANAAPNNRGGIGGTTWGLLGAASSFAGFGLAKATDGCCCNPSPSTP